jgi:uncharacterized membrane protein YheB (UPF0754 family)
MIAVKNMQNLSEILLQEELLQAVAGHYLDMVSDKQVTKLLEKIIKDSKCNHKEILTYMGGDLGKKPLPKSAGVLNG